MVNDATNDLFSRYSSVSMLNRVVAYILRFVHNSRQGVRIVGELTPDEIRGAHERVVRAIQREAFSADMKSLREGRSLSKKSKLLNLNPFLDNNGLLRVGGRLKHAPLTYAQKYPMLLPRSHHVTDLIVRHEHLWCYHAGIQATLNSVRHIYWPIDGKNTTKKVLHQCIRCRRANSKPPEFLIRII